MMWQPPRSPLFPYTTLFRSVVGGQRAHQSANRTTDLTDVYLTLPYLRFSRPHLSEIQQVVYHFGKTFHCLSNEGYLDRKSTRLNSSHSQISYAVFCLKKKNK